MKTLHILVIIFNLIILSVSAQSSFQNLDFESANPILVPGPNYPYVATTASAFPDWSVVVNDVPQPTVLYNGISTGATTATLVGVADQYLQPVAGAYSAVLQGITPGSFVSISQTGLIPISAQTVLFEAKAVFVNPSGIQPLQLSVGGQSVSFVPISSGSGYTLYGANISAWAGELEPLTFTVNGGNYSNWELDNITFSNVAVAPEPSIGSLAILGWFLFGSRYLLGVLPLKKHT